MIGFKFVTIRSSSNLTNQVTSVVAEAITLYSASELDLEIVLCLLDFYEMGDFPSMIIYPVTNFLVSGQEPQSLSEKACKVILSLADRRIP